MSIEFQSDFSRKESSARIISAKILIQDESCMERKGHVSKVESKYYHD